MHDFDVVIPNKNEDSFIERASALGYKKVVFLTDNINYTYPKPEGLSHKIHIYTAYFVKDTSEIARAKKKFDYVFAPADRKFFEWKSEPGIDFIIGVESSDRKDSFHYRSTSLNQVHAELAKSNELTLVFDFSMLISNPTVVKGKMLQNALLVKKYGLKYAVFSLAMTPSMMRSRNILDSLVSTLSLR